MNTNSGLFATAFAVGEEPDVSGRPDMHQLNIDICRSRFMEATLNPSVEGGAVYVAVADRLGDRNLLCLYGSLQGISRDLILEQLSDVDQIDLLVVRSTGGPVKIWLDIAEEIAGKVGAVLVDEICISSCANYAFILGDDKHVLENALVIWHGGPVKLSRSALLEGFDGEQASEQADEFVELATRTETLYERLAIAPALLSDTATLSMGPLERDFIDAIQVDRGEVVSIDGFAIDPLALKVCYGVGGLDNMWHPGFFQKVFQLGQARSSDLFVLMRPGIIQDPACGIDLE